MNTNIISIYLHNDGTTWWSASIHVNINEVELRRIMMFDAKPSRAEALQVAAQWIANHASDSNSGLIFQ
jgi:hypothetical protein